MSHDGEEIAGCGVLLIIVGAGVLFWPAALIVLGLLLVGVGCTRR